MLRLAAFLKDEGTVRQSVTWSSIFLQNDVDSTTMTHVIHPWALVSRAVRTAERIGPIVASMSSEMFTKSCVRCWPTVNAKRWLWRYVALRSTLRTTFGGQDKLADLRNDSSFKRWAGGTTGCKLNDSCWIALQPVSSAASRAKLLDCTIRRF